jgi:tRNA(fMet)-specific endonuclease VapC
VRFLLDTNTCIYALKRRGLVVDHLRQHSPADIAVSTITVAELWFGAVKSQAPEANRRSADAFLAPFEVLPFDSHAADAYAQARFELERAGQPIGERDLLIASIARASGLTVVTHNVSEFARVPGLMTADWL